MEYGPEYAPTEEELEQEEEEEPLMMQNAARWDNFLELVRASQKPWPQGAEDTVDYRKGRALEAFNLGTRCCRDLVALKQTMRTWVPHILVYIRPRQMVELGDPMRRSCDACESFGAITKMLIKHATCRRRLRGEEVEHEKKVSGTAATRRWKQTFSVGYIQQAFTRATVREALRHGKENEPYLLRIDAVRANTGVAGARKKWNDSPVAPMRPIYMLSRRGRHRARKRLSEGAQRGHTLGGESSGEWQIDSYTPTDWRRSRLCVMDVPCRPHSTSDL